MTATIERDALISDDEVYRYWLTRTWSDWTPDGRDTLLWVMLNPSTADARIDDATIRQVIWFTRAWGYRRAVVCNLFALRATNPHALARHDDPVGPDNDHWLYHHAARAAEIVCAWGAHRAAAGRAEQVTDLLCHYGPVYHLGQTRSGAPRHPCRLSQATAMQLWLPELDVV
jgi:hypothetical protein